MDFWSRMFNLLQTRILQAGWRPLGVKQILSVQERSPRTLGSLLVSLCWVVAVVDWLVGFPKSLLFGG